MCGIVGALSFADSTFSVDEDYLVRMRDTMLHRGPDGAGCWVSADRRVGLAHRRLAIIDLSSAATQPLSTADGRYWITFNGEIYNHAALRRELKQRGRTSWKTDHSDTEVILQAFAEWGIACLDKFRGMFAFAIWDAHRRELHLVRDRIGVKPLYYSVHHGRLTFASEIKALLADPDQKRDVNQEGLFHYLSFVTTPAPHTMFEGIHKLPPGTWLRFDDQGNRVEHRYWDVWDHTKPIEAPNEDHLALRVREELRTSVSYRMVSDVPVGVFLSGGIDSSTNAALFSSGGRRQPIKTFTIGYDGEYNSYKSEMHYARMMAKQVGAEHHELLLNVDHLLDFLPQMVRLQDEPIGDPVCVPVYYLSKLAREHGVTVCQVGEGADELFWGYPTWKLKLRLQQIDAFPVPRFLKRQVLAGMRACGMGQTQPYEALRRANDSQPIFWGGIDAFTQQAKEHLFSADMRQRFRGETSWSVIKPIHDRFMERAWERSNLNWMSYLDLNLRLPELLLMRVDKMSMGVGLEGRVPFLDHKLVELAMSIPQRTKTRGGTLKYILKKAVRGVIPDELIDRRKQGFGVPVYEWLFDKLGDRARLEVDAFCRQTNFLDHAAAMNIVNRGGARSWYLLNLALWWKQYIA